MVELKKNNAQYTKDKRDRYIKVIDACYKPLNTVTRKVFQLSAITTIVQFKNEQKPVKIFRTVFRRVLRKKDADTELQNYFLCWEMILSEDMSLKNLKEPQQPTWAGAQFEQPFISSFLKFSSFNLQQSFSQKSDTQQLTSSANKMKQMQNQMMLMMKDLQQLMTVKFNKSVSSA